MTTLPPVSTSPVSLHAIRKDPPPMRISDDGKKAIIELDGDEWEVTIEDLTAGASDRTLTISEALARKVQRCFKELVDKNAFEMTDVAEISLTGRATKDPVSRATTHVEIDKVETTKIDSSGPTRTKLEPQDVTARVKSVAAPVLESLAQELVNHDKELRSPAPVKPTTPPGSSPAAPTPATPGSAAAAPAASAATPPAASPKAKIDPLQTQFQSRDALPIADAADMLISQFYKSGSKVSKQDLKNAMADYVGGAIGRIFRKKDFEEAPGITMVHKDLQHIQKVDPAGLKASADKFTGGILSYGKFPDGELDRLLDPTTSLSADNKKLLVQLYAQYLRDGGAKIGPGFYEIFTKFSRDPSIPSQFQAVKQIAILEAETDGKLKITELSTGERISPNHRIYLLKKGDTYSIYDSAENASKKLKALKDITSLDPQEEPDAKDVADGKRCTDRSLAYQLLLQNPAGMPATDADLNRELSNRSDELRTRAIARFKEASFTARKTGETNNTANAEAVQASIRAMIEGNDLPSQKLLATLSDLQTKIGSSDTISADVITALKALPTSGARGDVFTALKGAIHEAYKAAKGRDSTDGDFGNSALNSSSTDRANAGYVKAAIAALIAKETAETDRLTALSTTGKVLTDEQALQLSTTYAEIIQHDPEAFLDGAFFAALTDVDAGARTPGHTFPPIAIISNNPTAGSAKPYKLMECFPKTTGPLEANTLYIWCDGPGLYKSFDKVPATLSKVEGI